MLDQAQLRERLLAGEVTWREALALITKHGRKAWKSKTWEVQRQAHLLAACTQCGSSEPPLVIQHMWHPRGLLVLRTALESRYYPEYEATHPKPVVEYPVGKGQTGACPVCHSTVIVYRKTMRSWRCIGTKNKIQCGATFETPFPLKVLTPEQVTEHAEAVRVAYRQWHLDFEVEYGDIFGPELVLQSIDEHLRYISLADTTTFCKKCAYMWDIKNVKLCDVCHQFYHSRIYRTCFTCKEKAT